MNARILFLVCDGRSGRLPFQPVSGQNFGIHWAIYFGCPREARSYDAAEINALIVRAAMRTPAEVFEDHLRLRVEGHLEEDLQRNYSEDVVLLTSNSDIVGHDAIRTSAARLAEQLPDARFTFLSKRVHGPYAFLIWEGRSTRLDATSGADSFLIEDGKIVFQSIHYSLTGR